MISRVPRSHYCFFPKTASIIGTFLVATTTSLTGNASFGVLSIAVLLVVALVFLLLQKGWGCGHFLGDNHAAIPWL